MTPQTSGTAEKILNPTRVGQDGSGSDDTTMGEKVEQARERAQNLNRRARERAVQVEGELEDYVREHPVKSVVTASAIGAGVGLLVGVLLARR
jgi:ElaB/YqjD/DUF883 family membrane-anchored ribosome-binding protein